MESSNKKMMAPTVYGSTCLGARGQVVIPKEARAELGLIKGERFVVMEKGGCLVLIPSYIATEFAKQMSKVLMS